MFSIKKHLNNIEEYMCAILLAGFVILMFAQIISRQILDHSIAWGDEVATYMFVWFAYLGAVVATKYGAHNRVTFHFKFFPAWVRLVSETIADVIWLLFNGYFVFLSYDFVFNKMNVFWKSQTTGIAMKYIYLILPVAFSLMMIRIVWSMVQRFSNNNGKESTVNTVRIAQSLKSQ